MQKQLRKLSISIKENKLNSAINLYLGLVKGGVSRKVIIYNIIKDLVPVLYRTISQKNPHGFLSLSAALDLQKHLDEDIDLPIIQAISYLASENKFAPIDFSSYQPLKKSSNLFEELVEYIKASDSTKTYRTFLSMLKNGRLDEETRSFLFKQALKDTANNGHRAYYLQGFFELESYLNTETAHFYYPCIAGLASENKDYSLYKSVKAFFKRHTMTHTSFADNTAILSLDEANILIDTAIKSYRESLFYFVFELLKEGKSIESIADSLILTASSLVLMTDEENWLKPVSCFNYCYALNTWIRKDSCNYKLLALYMMASVINHYAVDLKKVHYDGNLVYLKDPEILHSIDKAIKTSNVSHTLLLSHSYLLSGHDPEPLCKLLISRMVQLSSLNTLTYNLMFTSACLKEFSNNKSPKKPLIIVSLAKFLASLPKDKEISTLYKQKVSL